LLGRQFSGEWDNCSMTQEQIGTDELRWLEPMDEALTGRGSCSKPTPRGSVKVSKSGSKASRICGSVGGTESESHSI
jgi:hypothetical protein